MKSVSNKLCLVCAGQGRENDLFHGRPSFPDRIQPPHQRMERIYFVISICADQHQVLHIGLGHKILDQIDCCRVEPLQIVEEKGKRMLGLRKHSNKSAEDELESTLGVL